MRHAAAFVRTVRQAFSTRSPRLGAILGALALGFCASLVLLAAPTARLRVQALMNGAAPGEESGWALGVGATGLALLGSAAVVFVLARLVREAERRPYASLAPVLAVFCACLLIGLRAELPLPGLASELLAVFALLAAVCGGALVRAPTLIAQLAGLGLALFPALSLVVVLWAATGEADPARALGALSPRALAFLGMLLVSSFGVALIATLGRTAGAREGVERANPESGVQRAVRSDDGGSVSWRAVFLGTVALVVACGGLNVVLSRPRPGSAAPLAMAQGGAWVVPTASAANDEPEPVVDALPGSAPVVDDEVDVSPIDDATPTTAAFTARAGSGDADDGDARAQLSERHRSRRGSAIAARNGAYERAHKSKVVRREGRATRHVEARRPAAPRTAPPPWGDVLSEVPKPARRTAATPKPATTEDTPEAAAESAARIAAGAAAQRAPAARGSAPNGSLDDLMTRALGK